MSAVWADDDLVREWGDCAADARAPLFVLGPLQRFLDARGLGAGPVELTPLGDGHSNITCLARRDGAEFVVRRPPRPPLPPSAHDVLREARLLTALHGSSVPVPAVYAVCDDEAVVGAPFYVMARVEGTIVTTELPEEFSGLSARGRLGDSLVDTLADIGAIDWRAAGLEGFGRAEGYLARQVRRFGALWKATDSRAIPDIDRVAQWLERTLPRESRTGIVHGDFRLGNVMYAPGDPGQIVAVLDWELATIGDPLADLGYLLALWVERDDPSLGMFEQSGLTRLEGFRTRDQLLARYEQRIGRQVGQTRWYEVLALWKLAVLMEGNVQRATSGATDDPWLKSFGDGVLRLAERACELTQLRPVS